MAVFTGQNCSVRLGTVAVVGIGTWSLSGVTADQMEASDFGDNWKSFEFGMKDGGSITFSGLLDASDVTGYEELVYANNQNTDITDFRLYINSTSYYIPCATAGYFSPVHTTGADTQVSYVNITAVEIGAEKSSLCTVSFTAKVSGNMVLI
jgi:hypothetical protein